MHLRKYIHYFSFKVLPKLYIGGYPGEHGLDTVTTSGFDGCIDEVQIGSTSVDLNQNINSFEVIPGCPNKVINLFIIIFLKFIVSLR